MSDFARLNLICGAPGYGKSTFVERTYMPAVPHFKNALIYMEDVDTYGDAFKQYPLIKLSDYRGGYRRINADDIPYPTFCKMVDKYYRDGLLVIDEAGLYEKIYLSDHMIPIAKKRRKTNIEINLLYHGVSELPISSYKYVSNVILFHQAEDFATKNRVPKMKEMIAAKARIEAQVRKGNKYYFEVINLS